MDTVEFTGLENSTSLPQANASTVAEKPGIPPYIILFRTVVQNYVTFVVLVLGFVCNIWAMFLMKRPRIRVPVMSLYLFTLAVSDTGFLVTMLLRQSHRYFQTGVDLNLMHRASCALLKYTQEFFLAYSSWIITAISMERTLVVKLPFKAATLSTRRKAKITLLVMALIIAVLFSHALFMPDVVVLNGRKYCFVQEIYTYFEEYVRFSLMGTFTSYIPIAILTVCTTLLVHSLAMAKIQRQELRTNSTEVNSSMNRCTVTAVVICICYWIFSSAAMIMFLVIQINGWHIKPTPATHIMYGIIALTLTTRGSINFLLYTLTSATYRREMWCCRRTPSPSKESMVRQGAKSSKENVQQDTKTSQGDYEASATTMHG